MNGIKLKISKPKDKLPAGSSKLLGNPDVWNGFEWPYVEENGERYDLTFLCQINCAEVFPFDKEGLLPETGMLYFFYDLDTMPEATDGRSARVLWYDGDILTLNKMMLTDENGNSLTFCEQKIDFEEETEKEQPSHLLLGDATLNGTADLECIKNSGCEKDTVLLLQLCSIETEDAQISFKDSGRLCFYIDAGSLKERDFSRVKAVQTAR